MVRLVETQCRLWAGKSRQSCLVAENQSSLEANAEAHGGLLWDLLFLQGLQLLGTLLPK